MSVAGRWRRPTVIGAGLAAAIGGAGLPAPGGHAASATIDLICTVKGGTDDGRILYLTIDPKGRASFTANRWDYVSGRITPGTPQASNNPAYNNRPFARKEYVSPTARGFSFGYTIDIPETPEFKALDGPALSYDLDRYSGVLEQHHNGLVTIAACARAKPQF